MRERIAIGVCLLVLTVGVALSYLFAVRHNPAVAEMTPAPAPAPASRLAPAPKPATVPADQPPGRVSAKPDLERGQALFAQQGCATCHAIAGAGNPRHPLDGVGSRLDAEVTRDWILGAGAAADQLPVTVRRRKERFQKLPAEDLKALVAYMVSLKSDAGTGPER